MDKKQDTLSGQIRAAINSSGLSRYRICKTLGIDQGLMSRFMVGTRSLSLQNADAVGKLLRLRIVADGPAKADKGKAQAQKSR